MEIFERLESEVRSYCRSFPAVFEKAQGCSLFDNDGNEYLDFFSGAGTLNYGHNHPRMKAMLVEYIQQDGIIHGLDMATAAKASFLDRFAAVILKPRGLDYKIQFPGPTGTNAVEASLKLARKVTGREKILSFTNAFHGMTLGSLSVTGNSFKRHGAGVPLTMTVGMPYDGYFDGDMDTIEYIDQLLRDNGSGFDLPAATIVETVQGEGGLHAASSDWLKRLEALCRKYEMLLIVDDIQVGCGRTGPFFSFESAGLCPDIVCLSKSLSGYGLPLAITLIKPEHDQWQPGEHNGTFRGNNPAFVTAVEALTYWETDEFSKQVERKGEATQRFLHRLAQEYPQARAEVRGRGLIQGLACDVPGLAEDVCRVAFEHGLLAETSGPESEVIKVLPPLTISNAELEAGLRIIDTALAESLRTHRPPLVAAPPRPEQTEHATTSK